MVRQFLLLVATSWMGLGMNKGADTDRLQALEQKIERLRRAHDTVAPKEDHFSQAQHGWRMVTELVAGMLIGLVAGYGLDWLCGTMPVFLVIFTCLGFAAGVNVMMRTAKEVQVGFSSDDAHGKRG